MLLSSWLFIGQPIQGSQTGIHIWIVCKYKKIRCIIFYKPVHLILFPLLILQLTVLDPDSSERFLFFYKKANDGESPCKRKKSSFRMTAASFA